MVETSKIRVSQGMAYVSAEVYDAMIKEMLSREDDAGNRPVLLRVFTKKAKTMTSNTAVVVMPVMVRGLEGRTIMLGEPDARALKGKYESIESMVMVETVDVPSWESLKSIVVTPPRRIPPSCKTRSRPRAGRYRLDRTESPWAFLL